MKNHKNDIYSHDLIIEVLKNLQPVLEGSTKKLRKAISENKVRVKDESELWEHEWYSYEVFKCLSSLLNAVDRLRQSKIFIRKFPRPRSYEKEGISQDIWIEYHYSYYVITLVSSFDIALILTNSVFRLGNQERDCKPNLILKNYWVRETPVKKSLIELNELIKPHRQDRNLHVHRGEMPNIALVMNSEKLDRLKLISLVQQLSEPRIDKNILDLAYNNQVKEISKRLNSETYKISTVLDKLFNGLMPVYVEKVKYLDEKWRDYKSNINQTKS